MDIVNLPGSDGEKILQKQFKTMKDALNFYNRQVITYLSPLMQQFIAKQEMMFISTSDGKGECDASFRSGEAGFVMVLDKQHILYPEYKGNGVMASMGNIYENPHIGVLFLDFFETKVGLHINGKAKIISKDILETTLKLFSKNYTDFLNNFDKFKIISYVLIEVEEAYIHCSMHIPMLKKIETNRQYKFSKNIKGGDVFDVGHLSRPWVTNITEE